MENDLISRKAVSEVLKKLSDEPRYQHTDEDFYCGISSAMMEIDEIPAVDAVILPCKLGETVYVIRECSCHCADVNWKNKRRKCYEKVYLGKKMRAYHCGYVTEAHFELKHISSFGKMVFLTREEAEAALAKMNLGV